jgi:dTDP-glucose 4,6-dehydratase
VDYYALGGSKLLMWFVLPIFTALSGCRAGQGGLDRAVGLQLTYDYFKSLPQEELFKQPKEFNSKA